MELFKDKGKFASFLKELFKFHLREDI
jgi:hypothetical protein